MALKYQFYKYTIEGVQNAGEMTSVLALGCFCFCFALVGWGELFNISLYVIGHLRDGLQVQT